MKKNTFTNLFFLFLALSIHAQTYTSADSLRGKEGHYRKAIDIISYDLAVKVNIAEQLISGSNQIIFRIGKIPISKMQLDLFENMEIKSVTRSRQNLTYERTGNAFFVNFPQALIPGQVYVIDVEFFGKPTPAKMPPWDGGFVWHTTQDSVPWVGVACEGTGASLWWPNKDHLSDEPDSMWIRISVPDTLQAISNGKLMSKVKQTNHYTQWNWRVSYPINNYNVTLNIGKYKHFNDVYVHQEDTLSLDYYVLPENFAKAKAQFQQVKTTLQAFEHYFGKYPFYNDGYKLIETPYAGMEHQSAISYGNKYMKGYWGKHLEGIDFDYIIIHETGHEWWGNLVSVKDIADLWVHEGFCTYSEVLYVEYTLGKNAAEKYVNNMRNRVRNDRPIIGDYEVNNEGSSDMYNKGALMLHTLRKWMANDSAFLAMLKNIPKEFAYQTISSAQIETWMDSQTELNLKPFFNQYLRTHKIPVLEYYFEGKGKAQNLVYRWNAEKDFELPVKVLVEKGTYTTIYPKNLFQSLPLKQKSKKFAVDKTSGYFETLFLTE